MIHFIQITSEQLPSYETTAMSLWYLHFTISRFYCSCRLALRFLSIHSETVLCKDTVANIDGVLLDLRCNGTGVLSNDQSAKDSKDSRVDQCCHTLLTILDCLTPILKPAASSSIRLLHSDWSIPPSDVTAQRSDWSVEF